MPITCSAADRDLALATLHLSAVAKEALSPGAAPDLREAFAGSFSIGRENEAPPQRVP